MYCPARYSSRAHCATKWDGVSIQKKKKNGVTYLDAEHDVFELDVVAAHATPGEILECGRELQGHFSYGMQWQGLHRDQDPTHGKALSTARIQNLLVREGSNYVAERPIETLHDEDVPTLDLVRINKWWRKGIVQHFIDVYDVWVAQIRKELVSMAKLAFFFFFFGCREPSALPQQQLQQ